MVVCFYNATLSHLGCQDDFQETGTVVKTWSLKKNVNFSLSFRQVTLNFACARQVYAFFFFFSPFYDLIGL